MRTLRAILIALLIGTGFSSLVLWRRAHKEKKLHEEVARVEEEQHHKPLTLKKAISPLEPLLQGVLDYLWITEWPSTGMKTDSVVVDRSVKRLVISGTGTPHGCKLQLFNPNGQMVTPTKSSKVRMIALEDGTVFAIDKPEAGVWRMTTQGDGHMSLWVRSESTVGFDAFRVSTSSGEPVDVEAGEEIPSETGLDVTVRLSSKGTTQPHFYLVTEQGTRLQNAVTVVSSNQHPSGAGDRQENIFHLHWTTPYSTFRLVIEGHDAIAGNFQRVAPYAVRVLPH